jgi:hypothetical protein
MVLNLGVVDVDRMVQIVVIYILADPYQTPPWLFTGTVPANKYYVTGTVPAN